MERDAEFLLAKATLHSDDSIRGSFYVTGFGRPHNSPGCSFCGVVALPPGRGYHKQGCSSIVFLGVITP